MGFQAFRTLHFQADSVGDCMHAAVSDVWGFKTVLIGKDIQGVSMRCGPFWHMCVQ